MTGPGFRTIHLDAVEGRRDADTGADWLPLRHVLGVGAFGINAWRADAGGEVIERHDERDDGSTHGHEEAYLVLAGSARFTVGGEEVPAPAGTVVFVEDPALERVAVAEAPGTLVLSVGAARGRAFEVSTWERRSLTL
jgi:hypothetical protein